MSTEGTSGSRDDGERRPDAPGSSSGPTRDVAPSRRGSKGGGTDATPSPSDASGASGSSGRPSPAASGAASGRDSSSESSASATTVRPRVPLTQQIGRAVVFLLAVLFGVFAVANSQSVDFSWIFGGTEVQSAPDGSRVGGGVPLILLMVGSALVGAGITGFATWQAGRARRRAEAVRPTH
ncbi:MAG: hypothetical protein WDZ26_00925 [Nitriliruptoraceae bacterium]